MNLPRVSQPSSMRAVPASLGGTGPRPGPELRGQWRPGGAESVAVAKLWVGWGQHGRPSPARVLPAVAPEVLDARGRVPISPYNCRRTLSTNR